MARGQVLLTLHLAAFAWSAYGVWRNLEITGLAPGHGAHTYGGRWKYLTFMNQILQVVYFGICLSSDVVQLATPGRKKGAGRYLLQLRDVLFSILAFPVGAFVVLSFWSLYTYDRELVYPKFLDTIIPRWLNHSMHTTVLPLLLLDLAACPHQYPSKRKGLLALSVFCIAYMSWVLWIHYASGIWVYPILAKLDAVGMVVFFAASFVAMAPLYLLGEFLTKRVWDGAQGANKRK
ncbi:androgen-induced gene 1 protein-like [Ambystoma mexicanum]|uniref:androgen-induced gene 1 protein-like n=1 Tax=Ambystoma mexicanum TaxID=8296 RepID=UPI0037E71907